LLITAKTQALRARPGLIFPAKKRERKKKEEEKIACSNKVLHPYGERPPPEYRVED
jgi:hypothetical protein